MNETKVQKIIPEKSTESFDKLDQNIKRLLSGAIAGCISRTCTAPIERVAILQQTQNPTYLNCSIPRTFFNMVKYEGVLSCYRGNGANLIRIIPFASIELFTFDFYKHHLIKAFGDLVQPDNRSILYLIAGAAAGMTASSLVYPLDLVRTIFAANTHGKPYNGIIEAWTDIARRQGYRALFRGLGATCLGIAPYSSIKLTTFQTLKNKFGGKNGWTSSNMMNFLFGAVSGCVAITLTYPTDLLRKRFQVKALQNEVGSVKYFDVVRDIISREGLKGLYTGLPASYLRLIPIVAITLSVNERLKELWNI